MNTHKKTCKLTDQEKIEIVQKYKTKKYTYAQLGREYGITGESISALIKRRDIKSEKLIYNKRKYTINENFFDIIDTEEKAYFLGLLYADGYNCTTRNIVRITLKIEDEDILNKFKKAIDTNKPLYLYNYSKKHPSWSNQYCLAINSNHMSKQLAKLGCIQAKSLILEFPTEDQVPSHLIRHFIRGYFDGDGCIYIGKNGKYVVSTIDIISSKNFCIKLKNILENTLSFHINLNAKENKITHNCRILSKYNSIKFLDWLYNNSNIFLNRKYEKYILAKKLIIN